MEGRRKNCYEQLRDGILRHETYHEKVVKAEADNARN